MALNTFIETIKSKDLARQNRFSIHIQGPHGVDRDVNMLAESVSMPGQNILSVPDDLRFGPQREQAQGYTYGPISFTFLCTPGMPEKVYFEDWQNLVVNKNANQWTANYYRDYIGEIKVNQLDRSDSTNYTVEIHEAYPKTINAQEFSLGSTDAYQTITVEIAYRWWERVQATPAVEEVIRFKSRPKVRRKIQRPDNTVVGEAEAGDEHAGHTVKQALKVNTWIRKYLASTKPPIVVNIPPKKHKSMTVSNDPSFKPREFSGTTETSSDDDGGW